MTRYVFTWDFVGDLGWSGGTVSTALGEQNRSAALE